MTKRRVIERTYSWLNRYRRSVVRWEKSNRKYKDCFFSRSNTTMAVCPYAADGVSKKPLYLVMFSPLRYGILNGLADTRATRLAFNWRRRS
jgi:hypothetical protein